MPTQTHIPAGEEHLPPYRCGVGIVVFNRKGQALACKRAFQKNDMRGEADIQWPQGGIDIGEDELETARRELYEEVGIPRDKVELLMIGPDYTFYEFPDFVRELWKNSKAADNPSKYRGQRHRWFAFLLKDDKFEFKFDHHHEVEFESAEWVELGETPARVVEFKRSAYQQAADMFRPLVEKLRSKASA